MADETRTGHQDDPERTDVLPVLAQDAAPGPELPADSPTVVAATLGVEPTQPRLHILSSHPDDLSASLVAERERAATLGRQLDDARVEIEGLQDRQARLVAELEALRGLVPRQDANAAAPLREELAQLQASLAEHEAERSGWREARDAAFSDVSRLSRDLATADAALAKLRRELAAANGALARTRVTLAERDAELAALRVAVGSAREATATDRESVATLIPLEGAAPGAVRLGTRTRIGRADDNEVVLDTASVSRHHAIVIATARGVFIEDLNSVNGIYVNRKRVRQARLADGDLIALGGVTFRYSGPGAVGAPPAAEASRSP